MSTTGKINQKVLFIEMKVNIINQLDKGKIVTCLVKALNNWKSTVFDIKNPKDKIFNLVIKRYRCQFSY